MKTLKLQDIFHTLMDILKSNISLLLILYCRSSEVKYIEREGGGEGAHDGILHL